MTKKEIKALEIFKELKLLFPDAHCELLHETPFQLAVAVLLSAQTTDAAVNKVTPALFEKYPTSKEMAKAGISDIEFYIHHLGLYRNKAKHIKALSEMLEEKYQGIVPSTMEELTQLPGIGRKSANVIMSVCFDIPSMAVDTHVNRISKRLGFNKEKDSVLVVEKTLTKLLPKEYWNEAHHLFIFFGRYLCTAKNPMCEKCTLVKYCTNKK